MMPDILCPLRPGDTHRFVFANDTILLYPNTIDVLVDDYLCKNGVDLVKFAYSYKEKTELAEWSKRLSEWDEQLKSWNKSLSIKKKKLSSKIPQFLTKLFRQ
jgi:hypothetical protein